MEAIEQKFDYKTLSLQGQYVWKLCKQILRDLKNGECADEDIDRIIAGINAHKNGYINPEDYYPVEKAMKIMKVHRNEFFSLVKVAKVECRKINGHSIGYHKDDVQRMINLIPLIRKH